MSEAGEYVTVPVAEFQYLMDEVGRVRSGWSAAEAQIATLQALVKDLRQAHEAHTSDNWARLKCPICDQDA